jgi:hypothetical protein
MSLRVIAFIGEWLDTVGERIVPSSKLLPLPFDVEEIG